MRFRPLPRVAARALVMLLLGVSAGTRSAAQAPLPSVSISPGSLDFGGQPVGTTSGSQSVTISNSGTVQASNLSVGISGANTGDFAISGSGGGALAPGSSASISVSFTPTSTGSRSASLVITAAHLTATEVSLSGTGTAPAISIGPGSLDFGDQPVGTPSGSQSVTISNSGSAPLTINGVSITGANAGAFAATADSGQSRLAPLDTRTISISFTPSGVGSSSATLVISSDSSSGPTSVSLSGTGVAGVQRLAAVGTAVAAQGRVAIFGPDPSAPDRDVTAVIGVDDDSSLSLLDYAGTALLRVPPDSGSPAQVLLDTTRRALPDGVGLARILRVETSRAGVFALLILRADNTRGVYRLDKGVLTLLALLPEPTGTAELAIGDAGQIAYVAPISSIPSSPLGLYQAVGGQNPVLLVYHTQVIQSQALGLLTVVGISGLQSNGAGDLTYLLDLRRADGTPIRAVMRKTSAGNASVAVSGRTVERGQGAGVTGALTDFHQPRIGPDSTVAFLALGDGFVNFYGDGPSRPLQPLLPADNWSPAEGAYDLDIAADGAVALRAARGGSIAPALYLAAPPGGPRLVIADRRDIQPVGQPAFGPGGLLFFLAQNLDLPPDRNGRAPLGLYRTRTAGEPLKVEAVTLPGQSVPGTDARLLSVTQRPVVSTKEVTFGILFGGTAGMSVPTAALFRVPLLGTLQDGALVAAEGYAESEAGRLAMVHDLSYRSDGSLVISGQLPGGGPVILPGTLLAATASVVRSQAVRQAGGVIPLVATGDDLGPGQLESVLPPLIPLGADRELFVARISPSASQPRGPNLEGLFTVSRSRLDVGRVASTPRPAAADASFDGFADTRIVTLSPPSVYPDASAVNVVFKALLARGGTNPTGVFQWTGAGDPKVLALSDVPLVAGDPLPYNLERWAAGKNGLVYLQARTAAGKARLFGGSGGALKPMAEPGLTPVAGGGSLTDLTDFALSGSGEFLVAGVTTRGPGIFQLAQGQLAPIAVKGGPVPPMPDGRGQGFVFGDRFQLAPGTGRGDLIFRATVQKPGTAQIPRAEFSYRQGRLETRTIESVGVAGARDVPVETIADAFPSQSANGTVVTATFSQKEGWMIVRSQANREGTAVTTVVIAQERQGTQKNIARFVSLDAGPLLAGQGLPPSRGPVFTVNDAGDVAFLASDGKSWGVYQVPGPQSMQGR